MPSPARTRYQGLKDAVSLRRDIRYGEASRMRVKAGSVISITNVDGGRDVWLTALTDSERAFGLSAFEGVGDAGQPLPADGFDTRQMQMLAQNRDSQLNHGRGLRIFDASDVPGDIHIATMSQDAHLFCIVPVSPDYISTGGGGFAALSIQPPSNAINEATLPEPLGRVVDEWRVSRGTAKAYSLKKGQFVQIIDVEGQQCSDFMAMRSDALDRGLERFIDSTVSRTQTRSAYPLPGLHDKFFDQDINPLLAVRQDTVGRHDTFALACTARGYEERGFPGHINCSDNISAAFAPYGIQERRAWPAINFFFNSWIDWQDHHIATDEAWSRPGDYVALQALTDLVCVSTACPDDVDPINGWNPTDVHVRIYEESSDIQHAVSWRSNPGEAAQMTTHSAFHQRISKLTSNYQVARQLWMPTQYDATGAVAEYWACKEAATLQDMSGLRKFDIIGPDAEELLQLCMTRNVAKLSVHRGLYALICDERGTVLDDGTLFRLEPTAFRWCCGSDNSGLHLREQAEAHCLNVRVLSHGDKMQNLALQGPKSRDILRKLVFTQPSRPTIDNLNWFGFTIARLRDRDGPVFMLCRTGFTGELGYEIFCDRNDAVAIWDALVAEGAPLGMVPMGGHALEMLRIEAGLMISGAEFGPEADAFEAGLGFAVDFGKPEFIGRAALERNNTAPRRRLVGLHMSGNEVPHHGDGVFIGREQVGVITSACASPQLGHAIGMARVAIENAVTGTELEVGKLDGHMKRLGATIVDLPFLDPKREKARA
ncbi:aminomethyltransferase [Tateyamaria omphalii]|nr:aminomethyltransferase [Tateyamaria omphalii]